MRLRRFGRCTSGFGSGLTGASKAQVEGKADQASGQAQNIYGSAKDAVREGASTIGSEPDSFSSERKRRRDPT